jgi:hypothetical protein
MVDEDILDAWANPPDAVARGVMDLLGTQSAHRWDAEFAQAPVVREVALRGRRCLVAGYALTRGRGAGNDTAATVRAYCGDLGGPRLVAELSGEPYRGFGFFFDELVSPRPEAERLFLIWGVRSASNRRPTRIALLSFDAERIKEIWAEEDVPSAVVKVTKGGFSVARDVRQGEVPVGVGMTRRDDYVMLTDGPRLSATGVVARE